MKSIAATLGKLINEHLESLYAIPHEDFSYKPSPTKWSKKEIIGHLVDSAQSNIRRFVVSQYEDTPSILYNQDKWVIIAGYQQWDSKDLIQLWYLLNKQACKILDDSSPNAAQRTCQTSGLHTIEWLADDYIKHLRHHLHQVLGLDPVAYP